MKRTAAVLALLCSAMVSTADAQTGWLPRTVEMGPNLTGANRAAALARLESIERLLKQVPEFAHPDGFEIRPFFQGAGKSRLGLGGSEHTDYVIPYLFRVTFFYPSLTANKYATGAIIFAVNADENQHGWLDPQGRDIIIEQARWPLTPFSVVTYGTSPSGSLQPNDGFTLWTWLTAGAEFPWRALSREDYYNAMLALAEGNTDLRAELNRMTPAERKLPAILDADPTRTEWRATGSSMRDRDTVKNTVHRVLTPNYDFWRARKSLVEVRTINVYLEGSPARPVLNAIYQMYQKFDWHALAALIDQSTRD